MLASYWSRTTLTLDMMQPKVCHSPFNIQMERSSMISWIVICHVALILICFLFVIGEYVDMVKSGIIDPLKVIRTALVDAARYL